MKPLKDLAGQLVSTPVVADDVLEFHAARILLLTRYCGTRKRVTGLYEIDGLTKMAKLDFFVRYPSFFRAACGESLTGNGMTESPMIRYQYGPWDDRYYRVLSYLGARRLLRADRDGNKIRLVLEDVGRELAEDLASRQTFGHLLEHMQSVGRKFRNRSGNYLKSLIYAQFDTEVGQLPWGEAITG